LVDQKNQHMLEALTKITSPEVLSIAESEDGGDDKAIPIEGAESPSPREEQSSTESIAHTPTRTSKGALRRIHVIFGLCLEILAKTSSAGSSGTAMSNQSSVNLSTSAATDSALQGCLSALQSILDPVHIQAEFLKGVFLEMMTILERVAWMEGSRVQGLVVGVISTVIQGYGKELLFESRREDSSLEQVVVEGSEGRNLVSVLPESRLQSIVQLLVELYMQKSTRPSTKVGKSSSGRASQKVTMETVELMGRVTELLTVLVKVAPVQYQLHLGAVTLNVLVGEFPEPKIFLSCRQWFRQ
jgi:hypothetical protein